MKIKNILLSLLAVSLLPTIALAKAEKGENKGKGMQKLDTNGDQMISLQEAQAADAKRLVGNFAVIDADSDGQITKEEMRQHHQKRKEERMAKRKELDADGNGAISYDEASNAGAEKLVEHFDKIDGNGDGEINRQEMKEMRKMMGQGKGKNK